MISFFGGMKMARFELVSDFKDQFDLLPKRETEFSAGYDFRAAEDVELDSESIRRPVLVRTGVKAKLAPNQVLILANRSSNALKRNLIVPNGVGIIDADYYNNPDNEGEIMGMFSLIYGEKYLIHRGDRIMQGIITTYDRVDNDNASGVRAGGFGSTNDPDSWICPNCFIRNHTKPIEVGRKKRLICMECGSDFNPEDLIQKEGDTIGI